MALFRRSKKEEPQPEQGKENKPEQEQEEKEQPVLRVALDTKRMGAVYLRVYRWVFSVSLDFDSFQIESGFGTFGSAQLPQRGYYSRLLQLLSLNVVDEQRDDFLRIFSAQGLRAALAEQHTSVSEVFCFQKDASEISPEENANEWYEFRAEQIPDPAGARVQYLLYVRPASGEKDDGHLPQEKAPPVLAEGGYDWTAIRAERLLNNDRDIYFEYEIETDTLQIHRRRGDKQVDRREERFIGNLDARADWMVFHDSIKDVKELFHNAAQGLPGEAEIRYRKDAMQGAGFNYYTMVVRPLEEQSKPTWLYGSLRDVDEKVRAREQTKDVMFQLDSMLGSYYTNMFQIDQNKGLIYHIVRKGTGFQREKTPPKLEDYIRRHIASGVIAKDSAKEYLNWLQPGFLQRKTLKGSYEFEAQLKLLGAEQYSWYSETITAVEGRPGIYVRLRREINEVHQMREKQYEMQEMARYSEYNRSVLDTMASLVEFRNIENGLHVSRVRSLTELLLTDIAKRCPQYGLTKHVIDLYTQASTIHDIGKVTIPDSVLNKAGRFTSEEREIMKQHTVMGEQIVERLHMPGLEELKECCCDVVRHHHERFDGNGYPDGLAGDKISIGVQAVSLADVYDALVSVRCYKEAFSFDTALQMIQSGECGTFNPRVLESFVAAEPQMRELYEADPTITAQEAAAAHELLAERGVKGETVDV